MILVKKSVRCHGRSIISYDGLRLCTPDAIIIILGDVCRLENCMAKLRGVTRALMTVLIVGVLSVWHNCSATASGSDVTQDMEKARNTLVTQDPNGNRMYYESGDYQYSYVGEGKGIRLHGFSKNSALKKAKRVSLPSELDGYPVTRIAINAFYRNRYLEEVKVSDDIEIIGRSAFAKCVSLRKISIGRNMKIIEHDAFEGCEKLKTILGGESVQRIGWRAFKNCKSLKKMPFAINKNRMEHFSDVYVGAGLRKVVIDENMTISNRLFMNCKKLKVALIKTHQTVWHAESLFQNCTSLRKVVLPQNMAYIDEKMFMNCKKLTKLTIPAKTKWIGAKAFKNCRSLKTLKLPRSIKKIDKTAFAGCKNLTLFVTKGSYAHGFAKKNHLRYRLMR